MFSIFKKPKNDHNDRPRRPEIRSRRAPEERQAPVIFSYHARRNDNYTLSDEDDAGANQRDRQNLAASRLETAKPSGKRHVLRYVILIFVLLGICYELILSGSPTVLVTGDSSATIASANAGAYQQKATQLMNQSFSSRTKLTINTNQISKALQSSFPELESVSVTIPLIGSTATVHVMPSKAILADVLTDGSTIAIDARGVDISSSANSHVDSSLPKVTDQTGSRASAGHIVVPASTVSFITSVLYQLKSQSITVTGLTLPVGGSELDVSVAGVSYIGKFNLQEDPREQSGAYAATSKSLKSQSITPVNYIDVRIPGRAYYK